MKGAFQQPAEMVFLHSLLLLLASAKFATVCAQPAPAQQKRISAAIENAAHNKTIDWTQFVNPFIGDYAFFFCIVNIRMVDFFVKFQGLTTLAMSVLGHLCHLVW